MVTLNSFQPVSLWSETMSATVSRSAGSSGLHDAVDPVLMLTLHLSHLLLAALLLAGRAAGAAPNSSEAAVPPSTPDVVAREGSSVLITCNGSGLHDEVKWYNSRGALLIDATGRTECETCFYFERVFISAASRRKNHRRVPVRYFLSKDQISVWLADSKNCGFSV